MASRAATTDAELLRLLARVAILAPSGHNTQPWRFERRGETLALLADRTRALPVVDPDDRELTISCGAALGHARLAAARFGRRSTVRLLPAPDEPDLLATLALAEPAPIADPIARLYESLPRRRTDRGPYAPDPVGAEVLARLEAHAAREGVWLEVVTDDARKAALADAVAAGDRIQMADRRFRRELAAWVHPNRTRSRDGLPGYAFGMTNDLLSEAGPLVVRLFDAGSGQAAKDRALAEGSPALLVLGTDDDGPADWLRAGQALSTIALDVTASGLAMSYLNQPIELPELRGDVDVVLERRGFPQLLLRVGRPEGERDPRRTPRRPHPAARGRSRTRTFCASWGRRSFTRESGSTSTRSTPCGK